MTVDPLLVQQQVSAGAGTAYGVIGADLHVFGDGTPLYLLEEHRRPDPPDWSWLREMPSRMLNAHARVVPFTGRESERDELRTWRETGPRLAVRWLHAPGGRGKTRLAGHLAAQAADEGWKVVTAVPHVGTPSALLGSQDLRLDRHWGVLLIVDYADRYPLSSLLWLLRNALLHRADKPARVLMVARSASTWPALRANLDDPRVQAGTSEQYLAPLPDDEDARRAMFTAAHDSFAAVYGLSGPDAVPRLPNLGHPEFGLTLTVHVAALVAVDTRATGAQPPTQVTLLTRYLLDRERQHWTRLYEGRARGLNHGTPDDVMARTVFTAALAGPLPHPEAAGLLRRVERELPAERIISDHSHCYPAADPHRATVLEPLYPDRLAEDFIAHTLPGSDHPADPWAPTRLHDLLHEQPSPASDRPRPPATAATYTARAVTFLTAAAARWPHLGPAHLFPLLRDRPQLAIIAGSATLSTLAGMTDVDVTALEAVEALLPGDRHVDLDVGAAAVVDVLITRRLTKSDDPAEQARLHATRSWRLANAGRYADALAPISEAVAIRRRLADADPATHLPALARSLHNLGQVLSELGRPEEALAHSQEAGDTYRRLARSDPATYLSHLSRTLHNLGTVQGSLGRWDEALDHAQEAVTIGRLLADIDPTGHLPDLPGLLNNAIKLLAELGRHAATLALAEEAVTIGRRLTDTDRAAHGPELARSLQNLGNSLVHLHRPEEALAHSQEAADTFRQLADANPTAYLPELARSLTALGNTLVELGRPTAALAPSQEAAEVFRQLADTKPTAYLPELARSLNALGQVHAALGRWTEALALCGEAAAIGRRLVEAGAAAFLGHFARQVGNLGLAQTELGRQEQALVHLQEAVDAHRRLTAANPTAHRGDLGKALHNLGLVWDRLGQPERALACAEEAVSIARQLARAEPASHLPDLAQSLNNLAGFLALVGRGEEAIGFAEEAVAVTRKLAGAPPTAYLPELAQSLNNVGVYLSMVDRHEDALAACREAADLYRHLAEADPAVYLPATAQALCNLSLRLTELGRRTEALAPAEESVGIYRELARTNPAIQRDRRFTMALMAYARARSGARPG
ncbi:tetratricopeptide repeat protein [Micromonospora saelicesensis]|uniref:tetratricopeptide repeat protein n=1 Tax=Micromonospora saelicesensis TaxID=285676 RepID=UPI003D937041